MSSYCLYLCFASTLEEVHINIADVEAMILHSVAAHCNCILNWIVLCYYLQVQPTNLNELCTSGCQLCTSCLVTCRPLIGWTVCFLFSHIQPSDWLNLEDSTYMHIWLCFPFFLFLFLQSKPIWKAMYTTLSTSGIYDIITTLSTARIRTLQPSQQLALWYRYNPLASWHWHYYNFFSSWQWDIIWAFCTAVHLCYWF